MLSGAGVAMFHPEGGRIANLAAGENKANGMSIFAVGGIAEPFLGMAGDTLGLHTVMMLLAAISLIAILLAFIIFRKPSSCEK